MGFIVMFSYMIYFYHNHPISISYVLFLLSYKAFPTPLPSSPVPFHSPPAPHNPRRSCLFLLTM